MLRTRRTPVALALLTLALLTACAPGGDADPSGSADASGTPEGAITVMNCGVEITIEQPPERIVTIKSTMTEALIALGRSDLIVGTAFQDGPLPEGFTIDGDPVSLSDVMPSTEATLGEDPDLVLSGWESAFTADAVGTRDELAELGIASWVWPMACTGTEAPTSVSWADIWTAIGELARIVDADAQPLIAEQQQLVSTIAPIGEGQSTLWWSSGEDTPYVGAGDGAPQLIMDSLGLTNIASDLPAGWAPMGVEAIVAANPEVIVLVDAPWNTAERKIELLQSDPVLSQLPAVQAQRWITVPFSATEAGVQTAWAASHLAEQLQALDG